jgi:hypothetical protein
MNQRELKFRTGILVHKIAADPGQPSALPPLAGRKSLKPLPISTLLPAKVREQMLEAVRIDPEVPAGESPDRTRALESVLFHARIHYPQLFRDRY